MIPEVVTERLVLRGPRATDAGPLGRFLAGPRAAWIGGPWPADEATEWLDWQRGEWARHGRGSWIAALRAGGAAVGRVGLLDHDDLDEPELAWLLFDGFEGQGYATEAVAAARDHVTGPAGLPAPVSLIEPRNTRSAALAARLGARDEGPAQFRGMAVRRWRHRDGGAAR